MSHPPDPEPKPGFRSVPRTHPEGETSGPDPDFAPGADSVETGGNGGTGERANGDPHPLVGRLREGDPGEILRILSAGDPLHLLERCARRVRDEAFLLDVERVHEDVLAGITLSASTLPESSHAADWDDWLDERIEESMRCLLTSDQEGRRAGYGQLEEWDARYEFLTLTLGIAPRNSREACVAFNGLCADVRQAFFALVMEGKTIEVCLSEGLGPREKLLERCLHALRALFSGSVAGATVRGTETDS